MPCRSFLQGIFVCKKPGAEKNVKTLYVCTYNIVYLHYKNFKT